MTVVHHHFIMNGQGNVVQQASSGAIFSLARMRELEIQVDQWVEDNSVRDYIKTEFVDHMNNGSWGYELPTWVFRNEADAIMFKLIFSDKFDYQIYDA